MKKLSVLLKTESMKLRRSPILLISFFATLLTAFFVFFADSNRYASHLGWYVDELQPWNIFFLLPSITALLGSYLICREKDDDTFKTLRLIPVSPIQLTLVKLFLTFSLTIILSLFLFIFSIFGELILHHSLLPLPSMFHMLRQYLLNGIGIFLAVLPFITVCSFQKNGQWIALILTEIYSITGLFAGIADPFRTYYPITAIFQLSGYYPADFNKRLISLLILLLCGTLSLFVLWIFHGTKKTTATV